MPVSNCINGQRSRGKKQLRLLVASGKGGVGKSGLVINMAAAAAATGYSAVILDTDTNQHTCVEWRRAGGAIEVAKIEPPDIADALESYRHIDIVFIDTCGAVLARHGEAFECADLVLIPLSTSQPDRAPALRTFKKARARSRPTRFVLSLIDPSATEARRIAGQTLLRSLMPPETSDHNLQTWFMRSVITRRVPLRDAMDIGGTAFSTAHTARSRSEFEELFREVSTITRWSENGFG